jgi:hypothetical protein
MKDLSLNHTKLEEDQLIWSQNSHYSEVLRGTILALTKIDTVKRLSCT